MANTNFEFLKNVDNDLFEIITDAEKLYRGEFFEQCMGQTRRFGEHICRNVLGSNRTTEVTFDEMLATLKDKGTGNIEEKEFIDDLYFLKKCGNMSVHSATVKKDGITALECLQRSFEAALNYAVYAKNSDNDLLNLRYDVELLVTGKPSKKTLSDKYIEQRNKATSKSKGKNKKTLTEKSKTKKEKPQVSSMKSVPRRKKGVTPFWVVVSVSFIISLLMLVYILL